MVISSNFSEDNEIQQIYTKPPASKWNHLGIPYHPGIRWDSHMLLWTWFHRCCRRMCPFPRRRRQGRDGRLRGGNLQNHRKFNSSPLKMDGWKTILTFWGLVTFQGRTVKLLGGVIISFTSFCCWIFWSVTTLAPHDLVFCWSLPWCFFLLPPIGKIMLVKNWIISLGIGVKIKNVWNHHL